MRNFPLTVFVLSGVKLPVRNVFLYWTVITEDDPPAEAASMTVARLGSDLRDEQSVEVTGSLIGEGFDCWGYLTGQFDSRINVYRAMVPRTLVSRGGFYAVQPPAGFPGNTTFLDPFTPSTSVSQLPAYNGASLVVIGTGASKVAVYEAPLSGASFTPNQFGLAYPMRVPPNTTWSRVFLHMINSDGQTTGGTFVGGAFEGVGTNEGIAREFTRINGTRFTGPRARYFDDDWNGESGGDHELWDHNSYEITEVMPEGTRRITVQVRTDKSEHEGLDCLTPVANAVEFRP